MTKCLNSIQNKLFFFQLFIKLDILFSTADDYIAKYWLNGLETNPKTKKINLRKASPQKYLYQSFCQIVINI